MAFRVVRSLEEWRAAIGPAQRTVLAVGNFDGMHLGHQKILRGVAERARERGLLGAAVTFDPHPLRILRPAEAPPLLATLDQRLAGLEAMGLGAALVVRFDLAFSQLSPEKFVHAFLLQELRMAEILVGENFRFGHQQAGDVRLLSELGRRLDFGVEVVPQVIVAGQVVSSTAVRRAVNEGSMELAAELLGRPFALTGQIRPGTGRGQLVVVPTLNLAPEQELLPAIGVYATETCVAGLLYRSATNVGVRPTFDGRQLSVESHLFDFSERLTSGPMEVRFWKRLREERKFVGPEALREQIQEDLARAKEFFAQQDRTGTGQPA